MKLLTFEVTISPDPYNQGAENARDYRYIQMCNECGGKGLVGKDRLTDYHRRDYDHWTETCPQCKGSGRLAIKASIQVDPYVQPNPDR